MPLPELDVCEAGSVTREGQADIAVRFEKVEDLTPMQTVRPGIFAPLLKGCILPGEGLARSWFAVREIIVDPVSALDEGVLRLSVLGMTLAMLLHQRGELVVLYASVVDISGHAVDCAPSVYS